MMKPNELLDEAKTLQPQLQKWRRTIHRNPEVGFDLPKTKALVKQALTEMGYAPQDCGRAGVLALAGGKRPGKTILLRGDMDALPMTEESGLPFAAQNGHCHSLRSPERCLPPRCRARCTAAATICTRP